MGGICQSRPKFSNCEEQSHMLHLLKQERKEFDEKLSTLIFDLKKKSVHNKNNGLELEKKDIKPKDVLELFLEGVTEAQEKLAVKNYSEFKELGVLLEEYFDHGWDKESYQIEVIRNKLKEWYKKH